jgi:hypothetical protein
MADAGTSKLSGRIDRRETGISTSRVSSASSDGGRFSVGATVRVQDHWRSPLAGQSGRIAGISPRDACGPYLVQFANGLQFRYCENELVALNS